jgi:DNA primase
MPAFDPSCIDVEDYLDCLEMKNVGRATEREFRFSCPYPAHDDGDANPSAYMNAETTAFFCQSCHARGNAVSFAADVLGISPIEATRMLKQRYSPGGIDPDSRNMLEEIRKIRAKAKQSEKRENRIYDESILDAYRVDWSVAQHMHDCAWARYMFVERRFSIADLESWQFGYSQGFDRITLPIRDEKGRLVGIKARAYQDWKKPKYLNLHDQANGIESYLKNEIVFGLDRARHHGTNLIVVEGEYNVVAMHSHGYPQTVSINGSYFGDRQVALLKRFATSVTLFFDSDAAGYDATMALSDALRQFMPVYVCPEHHGDPAQMHYKSVDACLADRESLLRRRVLAKS